MNIKTISSLFIITLSLLAVSFFPSTALADVGDNCSVDLTSTVPDSQNWSNITILKGSDGSAWRRGTIQNPVDALLLKEGQTTDISSLVGARAPTQFFIYAVNEKTQGVLSKPSEGVCFEGPVANDAGIAVFPINARAVWGNLGKKLVLDVFYRRPQKYDEVSGSTTNENTQKESLQIYTFTLPRVVDVKLYVPPSTGSKESGKNQLSNDIETKPGKWESGKTGSPTGACGERLSRAFKCQEVFFDQKQAYDGWSNLAYTLDPTNIDPSLLGSNFDGVGGHPVQIGLYLKGWHTHYARLDPEVSNPPDVPVSELAKLTIKSKLLEVIKRLLEGKDLNIPYTRLENAPGAGAMYPMTQQYMIGDITLESLSQNADSNEIVKSIKILLSGNGDRNEAALSLAEDTVTHFKQAINDIDPVIFKDLILELFPQDGCNWAEDFLNILVFWTGNTTGNACVLSDIHTMNFSGIQGSLADWEWNFHNISDWFYLMGSTPLLLLNTTEPITLTPEFKDTTIVYSDKSFDSTNSWNLPAGKKQPLDYRYHVLRPFDGAMAGEMCVKQADLPALVAALSAAYGLTADETSVLSQELNSQLPATADFVKISLANPSDIASRIRWLGNGKPLSVLQLFFGFAPNACTSKSLIPPALTIRADRDGFEVGVIK